MDDVLEDNTTKLACGHRFCNDCYQVHSTEHSPAARVFPKAKATHVKLTFAVRVVLVV